MSRSIHIFLSVISPGLALVLCCLGLETGQHNLLGWSLLFFGLCVLVGTLINRWKHTASKPVIAEETGDHSFWLILPGFLTVFFGPPIEDIYLPETLPRTTTMQVAGMGLVGLAITIFTWTQSGCSRSHCYCYLRLRIACVWKRHCLPGNSVRAIEITPRRPTG